MDKNKELLPEEIFKEEYRKSIEMLVEKDRAENEKRLLNPIFRCSNITNCDKQLVSSCLTLPESPSFELQEIFCAGKKEESYLTIMFKTILGFKVTDTQKEVIFKGEEGEVVCTGHIDGVINIDGKEYLLEIKTCSQNYFFRIPTEFQVLTPEKFLMSSPFYYKYYNQIQLYMKAMELDACFLVFSDLRRIKPMIVKYDEEYANSQIKRIEKLYSFVKKKELPPYETIDKERITEDLCRYCQDYIKCDVYPKVFKERMKPIDDQSERLILELIERYSRLSPFVKEKNFVLKELHNNLDLIEFSDNLTIENKWIIKKSVLKKNEKESVRYRFIEIKEENPRYGELPCETNKIARLEEKSSYEDEEGEDYGEDEGDDE